jgi:hypothetical protein
MTVEDWRRMAAADAARRGLPGLEPLLDTLAEAMQALRAADFNGDAAGGSSGGRRDQRARSPR